MRLSMVLRLQEPLSEPWIRVLSSSIILFLLSWLVLSRGKKQRLLLPPGPPKLPLIGNLHQTPRNKPWKKYKEWSDEYGPIITVQNGAMTMIIISSWKIIKTHLERKSTIYSHRPSIPFFERVTGGLSAAILPYGERWKAHRNLRSTLLKPSMTLKYRHVQHIEATHLIHELLSTNDFTPLIRRSIASVFTTVAYGSRVEQDSDAEIEDLEKITQQVTLASEAAMSGVGAITALLFPSIGWLSSRWGSQADVLHIQLTAILENRAKVALQKPGWNWVKEIQRDEKAQNLSFKELAYVVGGLYEASISGAQALRIIIAAVILFPEAAARVRRELDEMVGKDRLPDFADCGQLPWTNAFIKEAMRWRSLAPLGAPRAAFQDDEYMGYHIPRETTIVVNTYALDHDEKIFPEPFRFKPERWIVDPSLPQSLYGFGQRGCPGRYMAQDSLFLVTSMVLWAFDIKSGEPGDLNEEMLLESAQGTSLTSFIPEFKAIFFPRSAQHRQIVQEQWKSVQESIETPLSGMP